MQSVTTSANTGSSSGDPVMGFIFILLFVGIGIAVWKRKRIGEWRERKRVLKPDPVKIDFNAVNQFGRAYSVFEYNLNNIKGSHGENPPLRSFLPKTLSDYEGIFIADIKKDVQTKVSMLMARQEKSLEGIFVWEYEDEEGAKTKEDHTITVKELQKELQKDLLEVYKTAIMIEIEKVKPGNDQSKDEKKLVENAPPVTTSNKNKNKKDKDK